MSELSPVRPAKPVAPWLGGKSRLADFIVEKINSTSHTTYAEPFMGMGGIFFRRDYRPKQEVVNDLNHDVVNLFRILREHYVQFMETLKWQLTTRADFERLIDTPADKLTDLQRAARFLYIQRIRFGGNIKSRNFGVQRGSPARFDLTKLASVLEDVHTRLAGVVVECLDYSRFIETYDSAGALFYLDPPYYGGENDYGAGMFSRAEFAKMAEQLAGIKGKFLLSINDTPEIRETFARFHFLDIQTLYTIGGADKAKVAPELLIANYESHSLL